SAQAVHFHALVGLAHMIAHETGRRFIEAVGGHPLQWQRCYRSREVSMPEQKLPLATAEIAARLVAAERDCVRDWLRALAAMPGNPFGAEWADFGDATARACSQIPAEV